MDLDYQDRLMRQHYGGSSVGSSQSVGFNLLVENFMINFFVLT